jgi:hypothetical protein
VTNCLTKIKYIKACPFLRDLGDSFLCVNDDKVADVILDPLIDIEWNEDLPPVATDIEDQETCLFVLEVEEDGRLFCVSRQMFLKMDNREIKWEDIRDSVYLLNLDEQSDNLNNEIDFCSSCLYKVLLASSPTFQSKIDCEEKIRLGWSYLLTKANEIHNSLYDLSNELTMIEKCEREKEATKSQLMDDWMTWLYNNLDYGGDLAPLWIEWFQKFDEWCLIISQIPEVKTNEEKVALVRQSFDYAARLKELSYEMLLKIAFIKGINEENHVIIKKAEKVFTVAGVQFENYCFIAQQFLEMVEEEIGKKHEKSESQE